MASPAETVARAEVELSSSFPDGAPPEAGEVPFRQALAALRSEGAAVVTARTLALAVERELVASLPPRPGEKLPAAELGRAVGGVLGEVPRLLVLKLCTASAPYACEVGQFRRGLWALKGRSPYFWLARIFVWLHRLHMNLPAEIVRESESAAAAVRLLFLRGSRSCQGMMPREALSVEVIQLIAAFLRVHPTRRTAAIGIPPFEFCSELEEFSEAIEPLRRGVRGQDPHSGARVRVSPSSREGVVKSVGIAVVTLDRFYTVRLGDGDTVEQWPEATVHRHCTSPFRFGRGEVVRAARAIEVRGSARTQVVQPGCLGLIACRFPEGGPRGRAANEYSVVWRRQAGMKCELRRRAVESDLDHASTPATLQKLVDDQRAESDESEEDDSSESDESAESGPCESLEVSLEIGDCSDAESESPDDQEDVSSDIEEEDWSDVETDDISVLGVPP